MGGAARGEEANQGEDKGREGRGRAEVGDRHRTPEEPWIEDGFGGHIEESRGGTAGEMRSGGEVVSHSGLAIGRRIAHLPAGCLAVVLVGKSQLPTRLRLRLHQLLLRLRPPPALRASLRPDSIQLGARVRGPSSLALHHLLCASNLCSHHLWPLQRVNKRGERGGAPAGNRDRGGGERGGMVQGVKGGGGDGKRDRWWRG